MANKRLLDSRVKDLSLEGLGETLHEERFGVFPTSYKVEVPSVFTDLCAVSASSAKTRVNRAASSLTCCKFAPG